MTTRIPYVRYLVLDEEEPYLAAQRCVRCNAHYFDHREVCAGCFGTAFDCERLPRDGVVQTFTIVHVAAPGIATPFIAAIVDCGGTAVQGRIVGVDATADQVRIGMPVTLTTYAVGTDSNDTEAIGHAFAPLGSV